MSLERAQALVAAFHRKFSLPAPKGPEDAGGVDWDAHSYRRGWIDSELTEHMEAVIARDVAGLADAYIDVLVFALGGLVELGVEGAPLFDAVIESQMSKVKLPGVPKLVKPAGWKHPAIGELIEAQRKR